MKGGRWRRYLDGKRVQLLDIYYSGVGILYELTPEEMEGAFQQHLAERNKEKRGCRISKYFLLGGSPALCPNAIEISHVFDAILYKRSSLPDIPFGMPYFSLFCFQLSKSMSFLMEKDNFLFFRSESCNEAY